MTRIDRVLDLLEFLRARDVTHLDEIAAELEVSTRTVLRDLATLRARGYPIHAETGPGGGIRLERDRGVSAVHLALDELAALWLAARLSSSVNRVPWSLAARSALDKVLASLPPPRAKALRMLVRRVVVGPPARPRVRSELGEPLPELLTAFESAFAQNRCLRLGYRDRLGKKTSRVVEPHGLLVEAPAWYVLARDTASGAARMFRMDRVHRVEVLADREFKPDFEGLRQQALAQRASEHRTP